MQPSRFCPVFAGVTVVFLSVIAPAAPACEGSAGKDPMESGIAAGPGGPVVFEGFGFGDFQGAGSIASALRKSDLRAPPPPAPLWLSVKGPTTPEQSANPLQAELKGRVEGIDLSAGLLADRTVIDSGPTKLFGGMAMAHDHTGGREAIELRTSIAQATNVARLAVELGPRIERRLPGGITLFFDGKAEAQSAPPQATIWQPLAGPAVDGVGVVGLIGRTGLTR